MKSNTNETVYNQMQRFAEITKTSIIKGNIKRAKKCLELVENLFESGSNELKNAITNVYIYSLSSFMEIHHCTIKDLFPKSLRMEYIKQINTSGV